MHHPSGASAHPFVDQLALARLHLRCVLVDHGAAEFQRLQAPDRLGVIREGFRF
jgi:hypothetical protein